jgi:hypothetical protein
MKLSGKKPSGAQMQTMRRGVLEPLAARLSSQGSAIVMPAERRKVRRVFIEVIRLLGPKKTKNGRKDQTQSEFFFRPFSVFLAK